MSIETRIPPNVLRLSRLPWVKGESWGPCAWEEQSFDALQMIALGAHLERLAPGQRGAPYHVHHFGEEVFFVLEGAATLRQRDGDGPEILVPVSAGDLCAFPPVSGGGGTRRPTSGAGQTLFHQFIADGPEPFVFLAVSTRPAHEVCEYPDHGFAGVRALGNKLRIRKAGYFEGEVEDAAARVIAEDEWPASVRAARPIADRPRVGRNQLPPNVVPQETQVERAWGKGAIGNMRKVLGEPAGAVEIGVHLVRVPAGMASSPLHYHLADEELFFVMSGHAVLEQGLDSVGPFAAPRPDFDRGVERVRLEVGDAIGFPPATGIAHHFVNDTTEEFVFLAVGTDCREDVCVYPRSGKILIGATGVLGYPVAVSDP